VEKDLVKIFLLQKVRDDLGGFDFHIYWCEFTECFGFVVVKKEYVFADLGNNGNVGFKEAYKTEVLFVFVS